MRVLISHEIVHRYAQPTTGVIELLRLKPRNHGGQYVVDWRIDVSESCLLQQHEDAFGNITHVLSGEDALEELRIRVDGEVETQDTHGIVSGSVERFPPRLYLRETPLTQADAAIAEFAAEARQAANDNVLGTLHQLMGRLHGQLELDDEGSGGTAAAEAFAAGKGACQEFAHIFIAAARHLEIPARYISGHVSGNGDSARRACHAWAEAFVPDLGWVAFDAVNNICPTDAHVRIAMGLDCLGAAPARGSHLGAGEVVVDVSVRVSQDRGQLQS